MGDETAQEKAKRMGWSLRAWEHVPGSWDAVVIEDRTERQKGMALAQPTEEGAKALALHGAITSPLF